MITKIHEGIYAHKEKYAKDLISMAHLSDSRIADTSLELNVKYDGPNSTLYCHLVGSLIYSTMTRPDVAHVV